MRREVAAKLFQKASEGSGLAG